MFLSTYARLIDSVVTDNIVDSFGVREIGDLTITIGPTAEDHIKLTINQDWRLLSERWDLIIDSALSAEELIVSVKKPGDQKELVIPPDAKMILLELGMGNMVSLANDFFQASFLATKEGKLKERRTLIVEYPDEDDFKCDFYKVLLNELSDPDFPDSDISNLLKLCTRGGREIRKHLPEELSEPILEFLPE